MKTFQSIAIAATLAMVAPAHAAEFKDFDAASFVAAKTQNRPILLEVAAWWCPVCASQARTISKAVAAPTYEKLVIFKINYDKQKPIWQSFGVQKQGTLIAYHGAQERGRLAFVTNKAQIAALISQTLK
jgi:thioredoxin 1